MPKSFFHIIQRACSFSTPSGLLVTAALLLCWFVWMLHSSKSSVLFPDGHAEWIRFDRPVNLIAQPIQDEVHVFRNRFSLSHDLSGAELRIQAMKGVAVYLDGKLLLDQIGETERWREKLHLRLPSLSAGGHWLVAVVRGRACHPALLTVGQGVDVATGTHWEVSADGKTWSPALLAKSPHPPEVARSFPSALQSLGQISPWLFLVFLMTAFWSWKASSFFPKASTVRWILLGLWGILAANNLFRIPYYVGMDVLDHVEYVKVIALQGRIPLATEGLQMFQSPLSYMLSAPLYLAFRGFGEETAKLILRALPMVCGLLQVEIAYRIGRTLWPDRHDIQIMAAAFGGFLPMNIYLSQVVGNEPLTGLFSSLAILVLLQRHMRGESLLAPRFAAYLGLLLGLALLSKVSALLLVFLLSAFCVLTEWRSREPSISIRSSLRFLGICFGFVALVAGWYYIRNWIHLGRPFIGGWDPSRGMAWWQDHGYIPISFFFRFGTALQWPVFAQTSGVWDGLYATLWTDASLSAIAVYRFRPPWNYDYMLSCAPLALLPSAALVWGAVRGIHRKTVLLSLGALFLYLGAILHLHITALPSYSTLKFTYLMSIAPCLVILVMNGLASLPPRPWITAFVRGAMAAWLVTVYAAYFVVSR